MAVNKDNEQISAKCLGLTEEKDNVQIYCKFWDFGTKEFNNEQWRTQPKSINQEQNELTKKNIWFGLLGINRLTKIKETCVLRPDCYIHDVYITYVYI